MSELPDTHAESAEGVPLLEDEVVLKNVHPSWLNWSKSIAVIGLVGGLGLIGVAAGNVNENLPYVILAVLFGGYVFLSRRRSRYVVTTQRVYKKVGLLRRTTHEARISDIHSLSTESSLLERLLGEGTVRIDSTGMSGLLLLNGTRSHEHFANTIRQQQQVLDE